ncbi:YhgE/Pip-like protein [Cytobacillus kochii]|nr:YhgE/Pip-like protein [Cytobacillus kochii]
MKIFKDKLTLATPILAFVIMFIFSLTLFPTVNPTPENLPVAIVNEDEGMEVNNQGSINIGETMVENIREAGSSTDDDEAAVKWVEVKNKEKVVEGLDNQEYYAALVIPKDFSEKQASLKTNHPANPEIDIIINQGMNAAASSMANQMLNQMVDQLNQQLRAQIFAELKTADTAVSVSQAEVLAEPIAVNHQNVNAVGENSANGNAPVSLFQPLWIAVMAIAAILFIAVNKMTVHSRKENITIKVGQIVIGLFASLIIGFGLPWLAEDLVGMNIPSFMDTALFLSATSFCFFLMILAVLSLLGIKGIAIFALLLFFGAPLLSMAPEMMSSFHQTWIYSWLPMRFLVEGLRELFYFGQSFSWDLISVQFWIGLVSIIVIFLTALKLKPKK